jgi:hypothetical protein
MFRCPWDRLSWTFVPAAVVVLSTGPGALAVRLDCAARLAKERSEADAESLPRPEPVSGDQPQPVGDEPQNPSDWQTLPSTAASVVRSAKAADVEGSVGLPCLLLLRRVGDFPLPSLPLLELFACQAVSTPRHVPYRPQGPPMN